MNKQKPQAKRKEVRQSGTPTNDNLPVQMAPDRRFIGGLPKVWIALSGLATLAWLIGIGWITVKLFRWLDV
jgi:hypothetical protein